MASTCSCFSPVPTPGRPRPESGPLHSYASRPLLRQEGLCVTKIRLRALRATRQGPRGLHPSPFTRASDVVLRGGRLASGCWQGSHGSHQRVPSAFQPQTALYTEVWVRVVLAGPQGLGGGAQEPGPTASDERSHDLAAQPCSNCTVAPSERSRDREGDLRPGRGRRQGCPGLTSGSQTPRVLVLRVSSTPAQGFGSRGSSRYVPDYPSIIYLGPFKEARWKYNMALRDFCPK